tara:strand:+ start:371 stop:799 length:429 start_codon:yes stop_codon:yes gene_type:complete
MWLSQAQYDSKVVQRLLSLRRLKLVQTEGAEEAPSPEPAPVPVAAPPPAPEPEPELVRARHDDGQFVADDPATPDVDEAWEEPAAIEDDVVVENVEVAAGHTREDLEAMTLPFIRPIANKLHLDIKGLKKADIIQAILDEES